MRGMPLDKRGKSRPIGEMVIQCHEGNEKSPLLDLWSLVEKGQQNIVTSWQNNAFIWKLHTQIHDMRAHTLKSSTQEQQLAK